ncbi:MAG: hypothetical protein QOH38_1125, partial [Thermoleophilaceae bacterium]|nr:hypothetical protein [Thermoleophilaceae bacterium]
MLWPCPDPLPVVVVEPPPLPWVLPLVLEEGVVPVADGVFAELPGEEAVLEGEPLVPRVDPRPATPAASW